MTLLISIICFQALPLFLVTLSHICPHAVFAPRVHSVFLTGVFPEFAFFFPLFAFGTAFLLHAVNGPMALLISEVSFQRIRVYPVAFSSMVAGALFAPIPQPIFVLTTLTKLTLAF
jgi:hypothetical protein